MKQAQIQTILNIKFKVLNKLQTGGMFYTDS